MVSPPLPSLSPDDIDDILYFARTNSFTDLQETLSALCTSYSTNPYDILLAAIDPETHNGALHMASANGHTAIISHILSLPSQPSTTTTTSLPTLSTNLLTARNTAGNTPLHWAALNGHLEAVKLLLTAGADPVVRNSAGHDAVYEAEVNGKEEVGRFILEKGGGLDVGIGGKEGEQKPDGEGEDVGVEEEEGGGEEEEGEVGVEEGIRGLGVGDGP